MAVIKHLVLNDVTLIFRNFSGKENTYNPEGNRNFAILLDKDEAEKLKKLGWNVRYIMSNNDGDDEQGILGISVNFQVGAPKFFKILNGERIPMGLDDLKDLDFFSLKDVNLIVFPYEWTVGERHGVKAYLDSITVTY
jgi:hypothetical protein